MKDYIYFLKLFYIFTVFFNSDILKNVLTALLHLITMNRDRSLQKDKSIKTFNTHFVLHNESHMGLEQCKGELFLFDE